MKVVIGRSPAVLLIALAVGCLGSSAWATPIEFGGSSSSLSANARFEDTGGKLVVTLTNTSTSDVAVPSQVLTAVFFDSSAALNLTRTSATVPTGSSVLFGSTDAGGGVGGEWAYRSSLSDAPGSRKYGIGSLGLGLFGPHDVFPGSNLQGPASLGGLEYGITSAADDPNTGNTPVTGKNALIKNQVVFVLSGLPAGFDASRDLSHVYFLYGTSLGEGGYEGPPVPVIPEPATSLLLMAGGLFACSKRAPRIR